MTSGRKVLYIVVGIIILAVIVYGGYRAWHHYKTVGMMTTTPASSLTATPSSTQNSSGLSNKTNTSNGQLNQDLQNIQGSMNQLQKDQTTSTQDTTLQTQDTPQQ